MSTDLTEQVREILLRQADNARIRALYHPTEELRRRELEAARRLEEAVAADGDY